MTDYRQETDIHLTEDVVCRPRFPHPVDRPAVLGPPGSRPVGVPPVKLVHLSVLSPVQSSPVSPTTTNIDLQQQQHQSHSVTQSTGTILD